jgi:cyclic beta-1,2-glucan synthetase
VLTLGCDALDLDARLELCIAPDADLELRRLRLRDRSGRARRIEVTACAEVALDRPAAFAGHPAFSKLFVQTEWDAARERLVARRRPRAPEDRVAAMGCALLGPGAVSFETDRVRWVGRGRSPADPAALRAPLSSAAGNVLDPVFALRRSVALDASGSAELLLLLAAGADRAALDAAFDRIGSVGGVSSVFAGAEAYERAQLAQFGLSEQQGAYLDELLGALVYVHPALRPPPEVVQRASGAVATLWGEGFGDRPLAVASADGDGGLAFARELLVARRYWAAKCADVDVLLLCDEAATDAARALATEANTQRGGRVAVWRRDEIEPTRIDIALAWAAGLLGSAWPDLASAKPAAPPARFRGNREQGASLETVALRADASNAYGGFAADEPEFVVQLVPDESGTPQRPPMPWINCLANERFGSLVGESGAAYTWSRNSQAHRITPWSNDPVCDPHGEAFYLRDEDAGAYWSPTPGPAPDGPPYETRHGFGFTTFRHMSGGFEQELTSFVPQDDPLKITRVRLVNVSGRARRVSLFAFQRLVLDSQIARSIATELDAATGVLFARNGLADEFRDGVAFAAVVAPPGAQLHASGDRAAFIGRNGSPAAPRALLCDATLDGRAGAGLDACFAWQATIEIPARGEVECAFLLGETTDAAEALALVRRYRADGAVDRALAATVAYWRDLLGGVQIETPVPAIDLMVNGWLAYQTASCRLFGRSAFYQSGGAFGFRDQLQDAAALVHLDPRFMRAQILRNAAHQFVEGDVMHWWHPPASKGTRTHFSDDLLWLPYLTGFYVHTTGDASVLDEVTGFRKARLLNPGEDEAYLETEAATERASVYEHCCMALDRSLTRGAHGLPLMGTGDWNDGMNRVGREGRGESVWVGFFLSTMLPDWIAFAEQRGEPERAQRYRDYRASLHDALEAAWDGAWYRRAYYDDGTPLGSQQSDECKIDALAQSWSVISGAAPRARAIAAMDAVESHLVLAQDGLIKLLAPPFDTTTHEPGYIKGYVPGIRENGGQYTHAACWVVRAEAELGRRDRAAALLERISPVWHAAPERVDTYQVEPYVIVADIYGVAPHVGRGGWTWYTGSAGWMYRVAIESVLGITISGGDTVALKPCIPDAWPGFKARIRLPDGRTIVAIDVANPSGRAESVVSLTLDGVPVERARISLDGAVHRVVATLG